eukprot:178056-Chlamydomonas_euryale.AAC.2
MKQQKEQLGSSRSNKGEIQMNIISNKENDAKTTPSISNDQSGSQSSQKSSKPHKNQGDSQSSKLHPTPEKTMHQAMDLAASTPLLSGPGARCCSPSRSRGRQWCPACARSDHAGTWNRVPIRLWLPPAACPSARPPGGS